MTNHPGDYYSFLQLARLREEELARKGRHHDLLAQAPRRPGVRATFAGFLRSAADRVEAHPISSDTPRAHRYQRAP